MISLPQKNWTAFRVLSRSRKIYVVSGAKRCSLSDEDKSACQSEQGQCRERPSSSQTSRSLPQRSPPAQRADPTFSLFCFLIKNPKFSVVTCMVQFLMATVWRSRGSNSGPMSLCTLLQDTGPECLSPPRARRESAPRIQEMCPAGRLWSSRCAQSPSARGSGGRMGTLPAGRWSWRGTAVPSRSRR